MTQEVIVAPPNGFPYFQWNEDTTKDYITNKPLKNGDFMVIVNTQFGVIRYKLAEVVASDSGKQHRVILSKSGESGGTSFYRTGVNCFHPKGQTAMIPPTLPPQIMEHLTLDCDVLLKWGHVI